MPQERACNAFKIYLEKSKKVNNLNVSATELTDLQNKALLKSALDNTVLDNNMANTLISNASTRGFRATTYNLGNALSGTVLVNASLGDVQYGTISSNTTFQFSGWAPTGTQSNVQLQLSIGNANAVITFPSQVVFANNNFGVTVVELVGVSTTTAAHFAAANGTLAVHVQLKTV